MCLGVKVNNICIFMYIFALSNFSDCLKFISNGHYFYFKETWYIMPKSNGKTIAGEKLIKKLRNVW